jgi:hypothetical protein
MHIEESEILDLKYYSEAQPITSAYFEVKLRDQVCSNEASVPLIGW